MPRVSVGMPVFNCERFVAQSIESILGQTYGDFELVISDNASSDHSEEVCRDYARRDARIRYVRQARNLGGPANFRHVFEIGGGEFQKWTTADDYWDTTFIEKAIRVLDEHPDVVLCYPKTRFVDERGTLVGDYDDNLHLLEPSPRDRFLRLLETIGLCHADVGVIRRSAMRRTRLMTEERSCDVHFVAELSLYGKFWVLPEPLYYRRLHADASSWNLADEASQRRYYDPTGRHGPGMQSWRKYARLSGAVLRGPATWAEKGAMLAHLGRRMAWDRTELSRDLAARIGWRPSRPRRSEPPAASS